MKRVLFALGFGLLVVVVGSSSGLDSIFVYGGAVLAAGFGWMFGGLPSGPSEAGPHVGAGPDGTGGGDGAGGSG